MRPRLGVNVDHVATVRQTRRGGHPDPVEAAMVAERAGADQITAHLREDRRHIQERDIDVLRRVVKTELNLELAPTQEMISLALKHSPDTVTLVPERRDELTIESGLDVIGQREIVQRAIRLLQDGNIRVAILVDSDLDQVRAAHKLDAHAVELHSGRYAEARSFKERSDEITRLQHCAKAARKLNLGVSAGHGLGYANVIPVAQILEVQELGIGHAIVARALLSGMESAVRDMLDLLRESRADVVRGGR